MVPDPTVACILLTKDRPEMARRAVASFRAQSYDPAKRFLLIWDTGNPDWYASMRGATNEQQWTPQGASGASIAALRNTANMSAGKSDIFAHFDSDDISHANRIAEQVALLQASGADAVGYRECLFWRTPLNRLAPGETLRSEATPKLTEDHETGEAWLYSNPDARYCIGSSLCYTRASWERHPFNENLSPTGRGEDREFVRAVNSMGVSSIDPYDSANRPLYRTQVDHECEPRMICSIHAGNAKHYPIETLEASDSWKRSPAWDSLCRAQMQL